MPTTTSCPNVKKSVTHSLIKSAEMVLVERVQRDCWGLKSVRPQICINVFDPGAIRESSSTGGVQSMFVYDFHSAEKLPSWTFPLSLLKGKGGCKNWLCQIPWKYLFICFMKRCLWLNNDAWVLDCSLWGMPLSFATWKAAITKILIIPFH